MLTLTLRTLTLTQMEVLIERHVLCVDLRSRRILSAFKTPAGARVPPQLSIMATNFTSYMSKVPAPSNHLVEF